MTTQPRLKSTFPAQNGGFWAWFGLQFGAKSVIIVGTEAAKLYCSFLTVAIQNRILFFDPSGKAVVQSLAALHQSIPEGFFITA